MNNRNNIVVTATGRAALRPGMKWLPIEGEQAAGVAQRSRLNADAQNTLIQSSAEILGKGIDPRHPVEPVTELVVGQVQSGKTLSFTTAIGLARDNDFPLVIVIAGNKENLLTQSHSRLARDLDVDGGEGLPNWMMEKNPRGQDAQYEQLIRQAIDNWRDPTRDRDEKPTLLLTVLKQNQRLASLTALLRRMDLQDVPALLIDDEADQASLNTKVQRGEESTTYRRLRELRDALPCHTFLQYTATPQAPLLINIADNLSPDFVHVLEPGAGYIGGAQFFALNSPYIRIIPPQDLLRPDALPTDPPSSLLEAMRVFFVGLAASLISRSGRRSMLIHPARERAAHQVAAGWATAAKDEWANALGAEQDPDRLEVVEDFRRAYEELEDTDDLPSFDEIIQKLPRALRNTTVIEFNTRGRPKAPEINWRHAEGWILVGGQAVDRGFTVDSLTVTYMPRGMGMGNADTLQQRARFFGYAAARGYFGRCRVYLEQAMRDAYEDYVEHEELMRRELRRIAERGEGLRSWRRRFILDPTLNPCRRSVISDPYARASMGGGWTRQIGTIVAPDSRAANMRLLVSLLSELDMEDDETYPGRTVGQQHEVARDVPLQKVFDTLAEYSLEDPRDTASFTGLLITLAEGLRQDQNATAAVYRMRPRAPIGSRDVENDSGEIENFQQGRTRTAGGGISYPGDAFFKAPDKISLQIHVYDLKLNGRPFASAVPLITVHVPAALAAAWLVQVQAGQKGAS
jgi:hypothetical protein